VLLAAQSKPKIQRIVWEEDRNISASASPSSGSVAQGMVIPLIPGSTEHMHHAHRGGGQARGFGRAPTQGYRSQPRHAARPMMQSSVVMRQRTPGGLQVTRQVARRARGRSPGGPRQTFYWRRLHRNLWLINCDFMCSSNCDCDFQKNASEPLQQLTKNSDERSVLIFEPAPPLEWCQRCSVLGCLSMILC